MKLKHLLISGFVACSMLTGCLVEPDFEPVVEGGIQISLDGSIEQTATKVNAQGFEDQDALGLYAVNYENSNQTPGTLQDKGNQADHVKYIFNEASWSWKPVKPVYYKDVNTNVDLYAFYPHAEPASVNEYNFEVQKDQNTEEKDGKLAGYEASDILWGKATNIAPTESAIKIKLQHKMAGIHVVLQKGTGFDEAGDWDLIDKNVIVTNTTRKASINLSTGVVTPVGGAQATGIVMALQSDNSFRSIVVPQTVAANTQLLSITIDGLNYSFSTDAAVTYESGKLTEFTLTVNRKTPTGEYELTLANTQILDWKEDLNITGGTARQYYCVHVTEPGTLKQLIKEDNKNPAKIKHLKVSGQIHSSDIYFMRDEMTILQSINLKEAEISPSYEYQCYFSTGSFKTLAFPKEMSLAEIQEIEPSVTSRSLSKIIERGVIPYQAFYKKNTLVNFVFPEYVSKIDYQAFKECNVLAGALIIPNDVTTIEDNAFYYCTSISSLSLPDNLQKIGKYAFQGCTSLTGSLYLPDSITEIGYSAFSGCIGFTGKLNLPENLTTLEGSSFHACSGFTGSLRIPESLSLIQNNTFNDCTGLNGQLELHSNLKLENSAFMNCKFQGELIIPTSVTEIPSSCFYGCQFSSIKFHDELLRIDRNAFEGCSRLMGTLELPESLVSLGTGVFNRCGQLEGIVFPSNLSVITSQAFYNCYMINKIICKSAVPPTIQSRAFEGVPKDNFTIEVPNGSVKAYQADPSWKEFKRISAHYDFAISRNLSRTLNKGKTQEYTLRAPANYSWSIDSKPDWITVTPSSGTGKANITVTFAEMQESDIETIEHPRYSSGNIIGYNKYNGRAGEVIFKLDDKDYTTSLTVEQFDYAYNDGDIITLNEATKGKGINIVILGDCYDAKDIATGSQYTDMEEAYTHLFAVEPYATYKDYFNVYAIIGESDDSGMGTLNTIRDSKFGSSFGEKNIVEPDMNMCFEYASKAGISKLSETLIILVENTTQYGGICFMYGDGTAVACCPKSADAYPYDFRGIVQHEAGGHGFGKLADEYIYHNAFISTCLCTDGCGHINDFNNGKARGWYKNLELTGNMNEVGWSHLIFNPKYSDDVDIFEGGYFHTRGVYRSEATSCMNNNIPYFSAISRQAIVERIMEYAGEEFTLEKFYELDSDEFGATTRSVDFGSVPTEAVFNGKQHAPVYMGERPDFRK